MSAQSPSQFLLLCIACADSRICDLPSRSSQKDILVWPRPIVYLPWETPSNFSSSAWSTHCTNIRGVVEDGAQQPEKLQTALATCLAGEVQLKGLDTDVRGTGSHDCSVSRGKRRKVERKSIVAGAYTAG